MVTRIKAGYKMNDGSVFRYKMTGRDVELQATILGFQRFLEPFSSPIDHKDVNCWVDCLGS